MKRRTIQHHMDGLAALLLFGVFAVCVLLVLITGASAYRRLTERDQSSYERRTAVQYIATRVRQADCLDSVFVEPFGDVDALVLADGDYLTRVYWYDGWLMELYCAAGADMEPRDGEKILEAGGLELSQEDGLLEAVLTNSDGGRDALRLSLRSGEEAAS